MILLAPRNLNQGVSLKFGENAKGVNDGSKDQSLEILREYEKKDSRIINWHNH